MKMLVVFEKGERLRHIGHLDLMRAMQRALRRSGLPLQYSQGFNPHILLSFAAPLSVGMPGEREVMEVPLSAAEDADEFKQKLGRSLPPEIVCLRAKPVDDRHPAPMSLLRAASYRFDFRGDAALTEAIPAFVAQTVIPAVRKTKTGDKPCDLRPMIYELKAENGAMYATLALCEAATCKPDLLLGTLAESAHADKPRALVTRTMLLGEWSGNLIPLENL